MILDRKHRGWAIFSFLFLAASGAWYMAYAADQPLGPRGGTTEGLAFGIVGTLFMVFAALLGLRKKFSHVRLGRASTWLKGHLWLGALSLPLIFFHGGFHFGGTLTTVLMVLFLIVFVTGLYGLALQQFLPRLMMRNLTTETVYEQIDHVREQLLEEARALVAGGGRGKGAVPKAKRAGRIQGRVVESRATAKAATAEEESGPDRGPLEAFIQDPMEPFFQEARQGRGGLWTPQSRALAFEHLRKRCDPALHGITRDLEWLCRQRAELEVQRRMHHWLHGWLFVHAPLSIALVFLGLVHAVLALSY